MTTYQPSEVTRESLEAGIATANTMLQAEALRRGWCSDYDDYVSRVNSEVGFVMFTPRPQPTDMVTMTISYRVPRVGYGAPTVRQLRGIVEPGLREHAGQYRDRLGDIIINVNREAVGE